MSKDNLKLPKPFKTSKLRILKIAQREDLSKISNSNILTIQQQIKNKEAYIQELKSNPLINAQDINRLIIR